MTNELLEEPFTWDQRLDQYTEIVLGRVPIKEVLYEIVRSALGASLPSSVPRPSSESELNHYFSGVRFSEDGRTIEEVQAQNVVKIDYFKGFPIKTAINYMGGKILFCGFLYDDHHEVDHTHVMRMAYMTLDQKVE